MIGIGDIEAAMIKAIKDAPLPYKLKHNKTYGGEFSDGMEQIVRDFPATLLAFSGGELLKDLRGSSQFKMRFIVFCCANSLRNEEAARKGAPGAVAGTGSYQIVKDVLLILNGQTLGLPINPLKAMRISAVSNDKANMQLASVYGVEFETGWVLQAGVDPALLGIFETFHANWDIPTFGNVGSDLPADDKADATDHVELEQ